MNSILTEDVVEEVAVCYVEVVETVSVFHCLCDGILDYVYHTFWRCRSCGAYHNPD